ncbi:MAG: hypothetical protein ACJAQ6_001486 [Arenicella sp.]|jgi:hypothetical protein
MHIPLNSVVALARFDLSGEHLLYAQQQLSEETDWQQWLNQIELHGLSGFANKHIETYDLPVPDALIMPLKALKARHTAATKARYQTLCEIDAIFKQRALPYVALKGAALMPTLFGQGYLRPMRDMDLLMPSECLAQAADCLREIGFDLPDAQPSKFMRDMHQLPNATKTVNGMISSVELHNDGISREVTGHFYYPKSAASLQTVSWGELQFQALEDVQMLHQVTKHLEGLHSGAVLKLINVMDVIGLAEHVATSGQWARLEQEYPHVINSLRCLHLLTPLPDLLQQKVGQLPSCMPSGVGQIMGSLRSALFGNKSLIEKFKPLLLPSDWWMHLYYNVNPNKSLLWTKLVRHPLRVSNWLLRRVYSGLLGG